MLGLSDCKAQAVNHHSLSSKDLVLLVSASPAPHTGPGTPCKQSINELNQGRLLPNQSAARKDLSQKVLGRLHLLILQLGNERFDKCFHSPSTI